MSVPSSTKTGFNRVRISEGLEVDGPAIFEAGFAGLSNPTGLSNKDVPVATTGTDTTPVVGTQYVTSLFVPVTFTITNVNYLIGSVGGTDRVYAVVYSATGAVLGSSTVASGGTVVGTAANIQTLALTTPITVNGGQRVFIGISINGTTARLRTVPAHCQNGILGGTVSQTHGTVAAITAPATFTANTAPYIFVN
jgi:hypothetical protein